MSREEWKPADEFEPLTYEKVVGLNNLLSIAWLSQGLLLAAPVARVVTPGWPATGFLIAPDLLLTNHHVLPVAPMAAKTVAEFNYQLSWAGVPDPVKRFALDADFFRTNPELDYTIVRVRESPGDLYGYIDLSLRAEPSINDFVNIVQHPNGGPKQICFTDNKVSAVFDHLVQYSTDTEGGSSGSPVFNQSWQIVGLHHRGGGLAGADGQKHFINEGVRINAIVRDAAAFLGLGDPLYDLAFGEMRAVLANLIDAAEPPTDPEVLSDNLLRTRPRFHAAVDEWATLNGEPDGEVVEMIAGVGIAIGAAIRQWARSGGHESIKAASSSTPAPPDALIGLVSQFNGSSEPPSDVYTQVLAAIRADPLLAAPAATRARQAEPATAAPRAFLIGVTVGAKAYDLPLRRL